MTFLKYLRYIKLDFFMLKWYFLLMIYLDNAATTKQDKISLETFSVYATEKFFNPSAIYSTNMSVEVENAREIILKKLGGLTNSTLIFTGSATEGNNMVLNSVKDNIIISAGEHPSVYEFCQNLLNQGKNIKIIPLQKNGEVDYQKLKEEVNEKTNLVSIIHVNGETGAINDLKKIKQIITNKNPKTLFHSDGVQAFLKIDFQLDMLDMDFYTISAHKIGGPKGIGAVYSKNKNKLRPLIYGGGQEFALRSGTENTPAIMAFAEIVKNRKPNLQHIIQLREELLSHLTEKGIEVSANGSPYVLSLSFENVNGETIVNMLKTKDIFISRGSACSSKKAGNRILESMGFNLEKIKGVVRISFFETNTLEEVKQAGKEINDSYKELKARTNK